MVHLSHLQIVLTITIIGVHGKNIDKRSLSDLKCHESGRFYRCLYVDRRLKKVHSGKKSIQLVVYGTKKQDVTSPYQIRPMTTELEKSLNPDRSVDDMWTSNECSRYLLCLEGEVFEFKCSKGLLFDVNRQLCDMPQNVHNCDVTTETLIPKPQLENAKCANETHLGCANDMCMPAEYFCDGAFDCEDNSDEGWCDVTYDPNAALPCDPGLCLLPECFCTKHGNETPNHIVPSQTPQMITLTFNGAVNHENWDIYTRQLFTLDRTNPNGCPIKATFFVSHPYTNYRHVQKLWNDGHEIAVHSITHRGPEEWWSKNATVEEWFDEMVGQANIINRFSKVWMEDFRGLRVPYLSVGWNRQFLMMQEFGFVYDATVVAPAVDPPYWPYTLDYKMPHSCTGNNQYCPTRSYAGLWEMVINPLIYGKHVCATLEYCPTNLNGDDIYQILMNNFKRHYLKNRAPFGIHLNATWLKNNEYLAAFRKFTDELLKLNDVYFVTYREVIDWIRRPTPVLQLKKFQPWQCNNKQFQESDIACGKPKTCKLPSKVLEHDKYMITCMDCPKSYPWIRNEFGLE